MQNFIPLTILTLFLFSCGVQTQQTQLQIVKTIIPTPSVMYTALPIPLPSSTRVSTEVLLPGTSTPIETITPLPNQTFHFGATPQSSQVGGISGVFYSEDTPDEDCAQHYSVFRFYEDGLVMHVPLCDDETAGDFSKTVWPDISTWFSRENTDKTTPQGIYYTVENKIWFTIVAEYPSHTVIIDYSGTLFEDRLILNSFSHPTGYQLGPEAREEVIIRLDICNCP